MNLETHFEHRAADAVAVAIAAIVEDGVSESDRQTELEAAMDALLDLGLVSAAPYLTWREFFDHTHHGFAADLVPTA